MSGSFGWRRRHPWRRRLARSPRSAAEADKKKLKAGRSLEAELNACGILEGESGEGTSTAKSQVEKKTFARRFKPTNARGLARWTALKNAFEVHVKPGLSSPSKSEATELGQKIM